MSLLTPRGGPRTSPRKFSLVEAPLDLSPRWIFHSKDFGGLNPTLHEGIPAGRVNLPQTCWFIKAQRNWWLWCLWGAPLGGSVCPHQGTWGHLESFHHFLKRIWGIEG